MNTPETQDLAAKIGKFINRHNQLPDTKTLQPLSELTEEQSESVFKIIAENVHHDSHFQLISQLRGKYSNAIEKVRTR